MSRRILATTFAVITAAAGLALGASSPAAAHDHGGHDCDWTAGWDHCPTPPPPPAPTPTGYNVIVGGNRHDVLFGTRQNDAIFGLAGRDRIFGRAGDDLIFGGRGGDNLHGGRGVDTIRGGIGRDKCVGDNDDRFINCETVIVRA
jgi:Ca2+-binding RTX toxin-like protein